ncbi:MAG: hypothetical protein ACKOC0_14040, partial [Cytophagales bacterium]
LFIQLEKMEYLKIGCVPSTPQLAELIKTILPQKIRTTIDVLNEFKQNQNPKKQILCIYQKISYLVVTK